MDKIASTSKLNNATMIEMYVKGIHKVNAYKKPEVKTPKAIIKKVMPRDAIVEKYGQMTVSKPAAARIANKIRDFILLNQDYMTR